MRPHSWTRAAETRVLPDRWMVLPIGTARKCSDSLSSPIQDPLALSISPMTDDEVNSSTVEISSDGLRLDTEVAWTVDFERAVERAWRLTMPLDPDLRRRHRPAVVVGVKASLSPEQTAERLSSCSMRITTDDGLAFRASGHTDEQHAAMLPRPSLADTDGALSFAVERGDPLTAARRATGRCSRAHSVCRRRWSSISQERSARTAERTAR